MAKTNLKFVLCRGFGAFGCVVAIPNICLAEDIQPNQNIPSCPPGFAGPVISQSTISFPKVDQEIEVEIGQSIISSSKGSVIKNKLILKQNIIFTGKYMKEFTVELPKGDYSAIYGKYEYEFPIKTSVFRYGNGKPRSGMSKPETSLYHDKKSNKVKARVYLGLSNKIIDIDQEKVSDEKCLEITNSGFKRELIYSGTSKGTVSLQYREFVNDFARPAFSQQLSYDLSEGNEIGYKGARFLILKATNVILRVKLLKPLD